VPKRVIVFPARCHKYPRFQYPIQISLGCHVQGVMLPHPEQRGWETQKSAAEGRLGCEMPKPDKRLLRKLRYWGRTLAYKVSPVSSSYFTNEHSRDLETWLSETHYPNPRKNDLRAVDARDLIGPVDVDSLANSYRVSGFVKDERYVEYKIARGIHPEHDDTKLIMGPIFKSIEKQVYSIPAFVKHVPVNERPEYILRLVEKPGWVKLATDFSSFEAGFDSDVMHAIEFPAYRIWLRNCPRQLALMKEYERLACGWRDVHYKDVTMRVRGRRLSGQMCTSLGNTWTNYVLLTYLLKDYIPLENMRMVVEGDDGLCSVPGELVDKLDFSIFTKAGFKIKVEKHREIETASFCGIVFDSTDLVNVTEPLSELVSFGMSGGQAIFADAKRRKMLLRAKSMSLAYQYHRCPILQALARYGLRVTGVVAPDMLKFITDHSGYDEWTRNKLLTASKLKITDMALAQVPYRSRLLVERLYGVSIDTQLRVESYLDAQTTLHELKIDVDFPPDWRDCFHRYVRTYSAGTSWRTIRDARPLLY